MDKTYLAGIKKQFYYYKLLGEQTFAQVEDRDLFHKISPESNSIAIIVNHMAGNMRSRFTDFLVSDGEKDWRQRDSEFTDLYSSREAMLLSWNSGWEIVFTAVDSVTDIRETVFIRNQGHTIYEALNRQAAHYAYHIGQIVFIGKSLKDRSWDSLSIPKNQSVKYNAEKFALEKKKGHFTDEYIDKP